MQIHELNTGAPAATDVLAMDTGSDTYKTTPGDVVPSYTSGDSSTATSWTSVTAVASGLSFSTLIWRITTMMKNVRFLYGLLGTTDISTIGDGTVTGALSTLNSKKITIYSICTGQTLTTTNTNYTTYSSRKFSDYDLLIFKFGTSLSNTRRTVAIPIALWASGSGINEVVYHGVNLDSACSITITYASDTSFSGYVAGSGAINHLTIYGIKLA